MSDEALFKQYGKHFQECIFHGLMEDQAWATAMHEVMRPDFFEIKYLSWLTERYFSYFSKYKTFPTFQLLISIVKDNLREGNDEVLRNQIVDFLKRGKTGEFNQDIQYVKEKSLDFCKRQAFKDALEKAVDMVSADNFEEVVSLMKKAVSVGLPSTIGHDFNEDMEARFVKINRMPVPTGLVELDSKEVLQGGLGRGELGVVLAPTGVGKSHYLVQMGVSAILAGKTVAHYTFELTETAVGIRYDSNLCSIPSNEVADHKHEVIEIYKELEFGKLIIKEYPTGTASVSTIRSHLEKLSLKGIVPNLVIIDYADIMKSSKHYDTPRFELKLVYEELRNLAMELNIPVWTASQANREAANSDVVGLENMSEAYGKAMVADFIVSISRKPSEKATGSGRLFVAKNRAGKDGIIFPINIDTSMSKFKILNEGALDAEELMANDRDDLKKRLKDKFSKIKDTDF